MNQYELADRLLPVALAAGKAIMRHYGGAVAVEQKTDASPVTQADREAEAVIVEGLRAVAPDVPVIAEEAVSAGQVPQTGERFFLVDPLDGTREFIEGRDEFTVNIALIERGRPVFGLVYTPARGRLYVTLGPDRAVRGMLEAGTAAPSLSSWPHERIRTRVPDLSALTVVASRSHMNEATEDYLAAFSIAHIAHAGSSLKFCVLAEGAADLYPRLGRTMEWDTAAGHGVLSAAGGVVLDLAGTPLIYGKRADGFANPPFVAWGRAPAS